MRRVSEQEARELLAKIKEAESYLFHSLWPEVEASQWRMRAVENKVRALLGEPLLDQYECYHICKDHQRVKR